MNYNQGSRKYFYFQLSKLFYLLSKLIVIKYTECVRIRFTDMRHIHRSNHPFSTDTTFSEKVKFLNDTHREKSTLK